MSEACPECGKEVSNSQALKMHRRVHGVDPGFKVGRGPKPAGIPETPLFDVPPTVIDGEPEPKPERQPFFRRRPKAEGSQPKPPPEPRPTTPRAKRVDASGMLERGWRWAGRQVERHYMLPTGRAIQVEAGAAGVIVAELVRGTWVDRPVQWLARKEDSLSAAWALLALPAMIEMGARNPAMIPDLAPHIVDAVIELGPAAAKAVAQQKKREADTAKALSAMAPLFGREAGEEVTPRDLLEWFYPPQPQQAAPQPAAA